MSTFYSLSLECGFFSRVWIFLSSVGLKPVVVEVVVGQVIEWGEGIGEVGGRWGDGENKSALFCALSL